MTQITVTKRDGRKEPLDLEKLHRVVFWATEGITGVSASEVEIKSHIQFYNGIKTSTIQETLIKSAADLITEDTPNYQYVAGRLINYHLRKEVYGEYEPPKLFEIVKKNVDLGMYTKEFERQIAERCHRRYAVAVGSCSQALIFAQQVLFDEPTKILIPTVSFVATINSVLLNGNTPVFCDVEIGRAHV